MTITVSPSGCKQKYMYFNTIFHAVQAYIKLIIKCNLNYQLNGVVYVGSIVGIV